MGHVNVDGLAVGTAWVKLPGRNQTSNESKPLQNGVIVIVDDDESVRTGLKALIESLGCEISTFSSAEDYLASELKENVACLILDVHLPSMSGPDLQAHLIAEACCPPTVFVTGQFDEQVRKQVIEAGALGYLTKPCQETALLNCIAKVLRKSA